jgi:hypothetical protein
VLLALGIARRLNATLLNYRFGKPSFG